MDIVHSFSVLKGTGDGFRLPKFSRDSGCIHRISLGHPLVRQGSLLAGARGPGIRKKHKNLTKLRKKKIYIYISWVVSPPSNSHHQDYYVFTRESL